MLSKAKTQSAHKAQAKTESKAMTKSQVYNEVVHEVSNILSHLTEHPLAQMAKSHDKVTKLVQQSKEKTGVEA